MRNLAARAAMMGGGGGSYPWDYRIEYLETSQTIPQWIEFGLYADDANSGLKFNGKCLFNTRRPSSEAAYGPYLFGGYDSNLKGFTCQTNSDSEYFRWQFRYGYGGRVWYGSSNLSTNTVYSLEVYYSTTAAYLKQNGTSMFSSTDTGPYSHVVVPLFCVWNLNSILKRFTWIRMIGAWSFEKGGSLYRNLIPCVKDGVVCVYDTVTQQFYYNAGSGSFTAGPRVADDGGGYKLKCPRRSYRRSSRPSARFWRTPLAWEVAA